MDHLEEIFGRMQKWTSQQGILNRRIRGASYHDDQSGKTKSEASSILTLGPTNRSQKVSRESFEKHRRITPTPIKRIKGW